MRNGFKEFDEPDKAIVGDTALSAEVVMIGRNESTEWQTALRTVLQ